VSRAPQATDRHISSWRQAIGDTWRPSHQDIAARAHAIYEHRGGSGGSDIGDWLQAERELFFKRTWELNKLSV
jgi:hypothetical protein